jgi:FkbM family methyltransferase
MKQVRRVRIIVLEVIMLALAVGVLAFATGRNVALKQVAPFVNLDNQEMAILQKNYGPAQNSEHGEEWIVRDFFKDERNGVFVDVGANDYKRFSNTYYLERQLGWSGIAIEPQTKFAADYGRHRPRTRFMPFFVSDASDREALLHVPKGNDLVASGSAEFAKALGGEGDTLVTKTVTLDDLLTRTGITKVDFLSMDIELGEPAALAGFSIDKYRPRLACIEAHPKVRQRVLDYFAERGYVVVGRYWRADAHNLWFAPRAKQP